MNQPTLWTTTEPATRLLSRGTHSFCVWTRIEQGGPPRLQFKCMSLFDFDAQHREAAAIWRLFQNMPLHYGLVDGRIFRWWAINIPLNLLPSSSFSGDIDLMVCTLST